MKSLNRITAYLLAFIMLFATMFGSIATAQAAGAPLQLNAVKDGENMVVTLKATESVSLCGIAGNWEYDDTVFEYVSLQVNNLTPTINPEQNYFNADSSTDVNFQAGSVLFTLTFKIIGEIEPNKDYTFSFKLIEAYYSDVNAEYGLSDFGWSKDELSFNYKEEAPVVKTYTVTFDSNGGSAVASQTVEEGKTATKPANPTREGYTFKYWTLNGREYDFNTAVTGNITLVAEWEEIIPEPEVFTLTFKVNGEVVATREVKDGDYLTDIPTATAPAGQVFVGWALEANTTQFAALLRAVANTYDFSTNPITRSMTFNAVFDETVELKDYHFTKNISATAEYPETSFTFTFTAKNGGPALPDVSVTVKSDDNKESYEVNLPDVTFQQAGEFTYEITEKPNPNAKDWEFSSAKFNLIVVVRQYGVNEFRVKQVEFQNPDGSKLQNPVFTNTYKVVPTQLVVTNVNKAPVKDDTKFTYTITFISETRTVGYVTVSDGTELKLGDSKTFTLDSKDNNTMTFTKIPQGVTFTLVEQGVAYHTHTGEGNVVETTTVNGSEKSLELTGKLTETENNITVTNEMPVAKLTVSKTVEGNPTYAEQPFTFTVTFTNLDQFAAADIQITNDKNITGENGVYKFVLKNGESVVFDGIPVGATYTVHEDGTELYTPSAKVNGTATGDQKNPGDDLDVNGTIALNENAVEVINTYSDNPITGLTIHGEMILIIALVLVALAGSFVLSRKLRRA